MKTSSIPQKIGASAINCSLVMMVAAPLYPLLGVELWKLATITAFFSYNLICRKRCIGMYVVHTFIEPPTSFRYAALYSLGFATFFYSVWFPMDLLLANGLLQVGSLAMTGNTLHGNLAGQGTMSRAQYLNECKKRAGALLLDGKPHEAVASMVNDLNHWSELAPSKWLIDMGYVLADGQDNTRNLVAWIDGFR